MKYLALAIALALCAITARAAIVSESDAKWQLADGSKVYSNHDTEAACWVAYPIKKAELSSRTSGQLYLGCQKKNLLKFGANPPPTDGDSDGVPDSTDKCPTVPAATPDGCPVTPPTAETWTKCADENGTCTFANTRTVRYGAGSTWVKRDIVAISGGVACANAVFGDPVPGTVKECQLSSVIPPQQPTPEIPGTGTADLSWQAPTQNTDGSPLTDLDGYVVSYGNACDARSKSEPVSASVWAYTVRNLTAGNWCFAVSAQNAAGAMSGASNTVTKVVQ